MSFKENLKTKMHLDKLLRRILYTLKEPPPNRWLDKDLAREILGMTDFKYKRARNLDLYIRPLKDKKMTEVLVLDNELPIYHTDVGDVTLRKSPHWQDVFSLRNIRRIMNDEDIVVSRGKESLEKLHANALGRLPLDYSRQDLEALIEDARQGLDQNSTQQVRETLDLFFELLGFESVYFEFAEPELHFFGKPILGRGAAPSFEHLIIFNQETRSLGLKKGAFSTKNESDLAWVTRYDQGLETADLRGIDVFEFLADLALEEEARGGRKQMGFRGRIDALPIS